MMNNMYFNVISVAVAIITALMLYHILVKSKKNYNRLLRLMALVVFVLGIVVYYIGITHVDYWYEEKFIGTHQSWLASFLRASLYSIGMFAFQSGFTDISQSLQSSQTYMACFSSLHFAAAAISSLFALHYLFTRCRSWWRWQILKFLRFWKKDIHVFFDINDATRFLVEDIHKQYPGHIILLVEYADSSLKEDTKTFAALLDLFTANKAMLQLVRESDAIIKKLNMPLYKHSLDEKFSVCHQLNLKWFVKRGGKCKFYFMGDDENENVKSAIILQNDKVLKEANKSCINIYAHASLQGSNRSLRTLRQNGVEITLVDSAMLAVHDLMTKTDNNDKQKYPNHPINFVEISPAYDGIVKSPFNAMVVGFGETGQEVVKFLYEFGQFIYDDKTDDSKFHCHIVDANLGELKGRFLAQRPGLRKEKFAWWSFNYNSAAFWELVKQEINLLNYIVITTGSEGDFSLALDIYEYAKVHRQGGLNNFSIFVRVANRIEVTRLEKFTKLAENKITIFGEPKSIFTSRNVHKDEFIQDAARYYVSYSLTAGDQLPPLQEGELNDKEYALKCWNARHDKDKVFADILRQESQDLANAYHGYTKLKLCGILDGDDHSADETTKTNLSRLEHLRWMASHEMMGYTQGAKKDCEKKTHPCMIPWGGLSAKIQSYDTCVLDTTVRLFKEQINS